jgi:hypothetical protein
MATGGADEFHAAIKGDFELTASIDPRDDGR